MNISVMAKGFAVGVLLLCTLPSMCEVWDFDRCVGYARQNNINLRQSGLAAQTASYNLDESRAQWWPTLDFGTSQGFANTPWSVAKQNAYMSSYALNAGWTVWDGNVRSNNIKRYALLKERAEVNIAELMRTIESDLMQVYLNILYARESVAVADEGLSLSKAQYEQAKQWMEAGKISRVESSQLQSQYEQANYALVSARAIFDNRILELKQLLELGGDVDLQLADLVAVSDTVFAPLPAMSESVQLALDTDFSLRMYQLDRESARLDERIASSGRSPKISLNASIGTSYNTPGNMLAGYKQNWGENIALSLSIPILDQNKTKIAVSKAKLQTANAEADIEKRKIEISQLVEKWYIDTNSSRAKYRAAQSQLDVATLNYKLNQERFNLGFINTVELMQSYNDLIESKYALLQSKYMALLGEKMIDFYRSGHITLR